MSEVKDKSRVPARRACSPNTSSPWSASSCSCWPSTARWKSGSAIAASRPRSTDGMSEKAEATAKRIEQSMSDLERQINWVTRASSNTLATLNAPRRLCAIAAAGAAGQPALAAQRPGPRAAPPDAPDRHARQQRRFLPRRPIHRNRRARHQFCAGLFPRRAAVHVDRAVAFGRQRHRRRDRPRFPVGIFRATPRSARWRLPMSSMPRARCWRVRRTGPRSARTCRRCRRSPPLRSPAAWRWRRAPMRSGNAVLTTSSVVPKLGWHVFFEQATAQALTPIRDQLVRIALLIALGLVVAIIAGTIMARRMLVPITALRAGARRLGAGDFGHRIEVKTVRRAGRAGQPVQRHGRPARRDLFRPRIEGEGADAGSGAVDQRAQGARGGRPRGRLLARPQRGAADGRGARARDHPCRRGADLRL